MENVQDKKILLYNIDRILNGIQKFGILVRDEIEICFLSLKLFSYISL